MNNFKWAAGALLAYGLYLIATKKDGETIDLTQAAADTENFIVRSFNAATDIIGDLTMGVLKLSRLNDAKPSMLNNPNVKAMLAVIRSGEGTADPNGYRRLFGGQLFTSFADHPRILVKKSGYSSTAAGAYQFLSRVWDETAKIMGLKDFSPANQDLAALGRIAARGALDDVIAGRFEIAVKKLAKEWASLPFSPYGQPTKTLAQAKTVYLANNGTITTA